MKKKSFLQNVVDQPSNLRNALVNYPINIGDNLFRRYQSNTFDRIILSGHGASYNSLYPSFLKLNSCSIHTTLWLTSELIHYGINQIDEKTLLIVNSQSGQSAEVVSLVEKTNNLHCPFSLVALTNDPTSVLGNSSDHIIPLNAGIEEGVATKTYVNALGMLTLFVSQLCGESINVVINELNAACSVMEQYLADLDSRIEEIDKKIGIIRSTIVVGRGQSMATAWTAALNQKEAAWLFTEGMNAGEFRHGPLELADQNMTLVILEGDAKTVKLNVALAKEVATYGSQVIWIGNHPPEGITSIEMPTVSELARPLAEILPMQLLAYVLAARQDLEPGKFRRIGKIVMKE